MSTPDIFLSYNREDAARAKLFAEKLTAEGFSVWWDATLRSGENYDEVTEAALRDASAVVVLWSERSVVSRWVRAEATEAERAGKLVPAMIEPCKRPIMFELKQTAELSHWKGNRKDPAWQAFVSDLRGLAGRSETAGSPTTTERPPSSGKPRWHVLWPWAAIAVILLGASVLAWMQLGGGAQSTGDVPVLVRAFAASGSDSTETQLASGITDELIVRLRRIPELQVATAHADGTPPSDAFERANVVEGNIRSSGDQLRVTVRLADADGNILWSDTFDRKLSDMFEVQEAIAAAIAGTLSVSLDVGANSHDSGGTDNPEAYAAYMQGFAHSIDPDPATAQRYYERAVALDPNFVKGWFGLAALAEPGRTNAPAEADRILRQRDEYSSKALAANPNHWLGQNSRGGYELARKNLAAAQRYFSRSAELDRGDDPQLRTYLANWDMIMGRVKRADTIRRSNEIIDPIHRYDPWRIYDFVMLRRYDDAIDLYTRLERNGSTALGGFARWVFFAHLLGRTEAEAVKFASRGGPALEAQLAEFNAAKAALNMSDAELAQSVAELGSSSISNRALYVAHLGQPERALKLMHLALEKPGGTALLTLWHPAMATARKTPEFERLVTELGFVEAWRESGVWGDFCKPRQDGGISCS